ncbi:MAG: hypothetical protein ABIJ28_00880 [Patescibacteria group bacterium]
MKDSRFKIQDSRNGQAVITVTLFLLIISLVVVTGFSSIVLGESKTSQNFISSKKTFFLSEAGVEDVTYRMIKSKSYSANEQLSLDGFTVNTSIFAVGNTKEITATGNVNEDIRKVKTILTTGEGTSFFYGLQTDTGGIIMENTSSVTGNVYSNGTVIGANSNIIRGSVVSAGPTGLINGSHATGTAFAHTISNSDIDGDAYYQNISGTTVDGTLYPNSPDQPITDMPIKDSKIDEWKAAAEAGGVINSPCPYEIDSDITLGPIKINCNLEIDGDPEITLQGMVWVVGNINIKNTAIIRLDSSLGSQSLAMIADNPANRTTSSKIDLNNSVQFFDSGTDGSYVLMVSQNNSAELGGAQVAIDVDNSVNGKLLVYAGHGEIRLSNSVSLKEVTGHRVRLRNSANVIYETGLASLLFQAGPGGAYTILSWEEI